MSELRIDLFLERMKIKGRKKEGKGTDVIKNNKTERNGKGVRKGKREGERVKKNREEGRKEEKKRRRGEEKRERGRRKGREKRISTTMVMTDKTTAPEICPPSTINNQQSTFKKKKYASGGERGMLLFNCHGANVSHPLYIFILYQCLHRPSLLSFSSYLVYPLLPFFSLSRQHSFLISRHPMSPALLIHFPTVWSHLSLIHQPLIVT